MSCHGGCRFEKRWVRLGGLLRGLGSDGGLEVLEGFESTEVHAVGGIDAPLNASKGIDRVLVGVAERELC